MSIDTLRKLDGGDDGSGNEEDWRGWLAEVTDRPGIDTDQLVPYVGRVGMLGLEGGVVSRVGARDMLPVAIGAFAAANTTPN